MSAAHEEPRGDVVVIPEPATDDTGLDPRAWVEAVRRPTCRELRRAVADYLAEARDLGET